MNKMEYDNSIIDAENYRSNESFGFKDIVMRQLQRVVTNSSQEMRQGFWVYVNIPNMNPEKSKYIGDSRKELTQSIDCLHDLLMPKFDKEMKKFSEEIYLKVEEVKEGSENKITFWNKKLKIYREIFQQLCLFLDRLGWLETMEIEE